ncbi:MAG: hypothetical protein ABFS18_07515 [Thermodesulfobacteriota bacterium]
MKIDKYTFGGISGVLILYAVVLFDELGSVLLGGDSGAFLWTTFHFVINPLLCSIYLILTVLKMINKKDKYRWFSITGIALALFYLYIAVSGNTLWIDLLGIDFKS